MRAERLAPAQKARASRRPESSTKSSTTSSKEDLKVETIEQLHRAKTGAIIQEGPGQGSADMRVGDVDT